MYVSCKYRGSGHVTHSIGLVDTSRGRRGEIYLSTNTRQLEHRTQMRGSSRTIYENRWNIERLI